MLSGTFWTEQYLVVLSYGHSAVIEETQHMFVLALWQWLERHFVCIRWKPSSRFVAQDSTVQCLLPFGRHLFTKKNYYFFNPSLAQPVKFLGWKVHIMTISSRFPGPITNLLSVLCVLMKILSPASAKKKAETFMIWNFAPLQVVFRWYHWQWKGSILAFWGAGRVVFPI